jgi:hypothetical protein
MLKRSWRKARDANDRATTAETHAQEVEESVAPRRFTKEQNAVITTNLLRFHGQRVAAYHNTFDVEAGVFASELLKALGAAKWDLNPNFGIDARLSAIVRAPYILETGILIRATEHKSSQIAADALLRELLMNGFDARKSPMAYPSRPQSLRS